MTSSSNTDNRYMELRIGEQLYAVHLLDVREVIQQPEVTQVPNSPADFEGIMNLRGQIMGVFNIRKKLGAKAKAGTEHSPPVIVIVETGEVRVGITVDEVTRVLHPSHEAVRAAPVREDDSSKRFVESVLQIGDDLVLVLELSQLLDIQKIKKLAA